MTNPNNPNNLSVYSYVNSHGETIYGYNLPTGNIAEVNVDNINRGANVNSAFAPVYPATYTNPLSLTLRQEFNQPQYVNNIGLQALSGVTNVFDFAMKSLPNGFWLNSNFPANYLASRPVVALAIADGTPPNSAVPKDWPSAQLHYAIYGETESVNAAAAATFINSIFSKSGVTETQAAIAATVSLPTYAMQVGTDTYTSVAGSIFTAAANNVFDATDVIDGKNVGVSTLSANINTAATTAQATIKNVGTYNLAYTAAGTVDATNFSGATNVNFVNSLTFGGNTYTTAANGSISNLSSLPVFAMNGTAAKTFIASVTATALTSNPNLVLNVNGVTTGASFTLNQTTSGRVGKTTVNSSGNAANTITLAGTALQGMTELDVVTMANATAIVSVNSGVTSVRTVVASGPAASTVLFNDSTTGSTANGVTATFSTAGSKIGFASNFSPTANTVTFTGSNNSLVLTSAVANGVAANLSNYSGLDTLEISNALGAALNMNYFGSNVKNLNLDSGIGGSVAVNNMQNTSTVNIGTANNAVIGTSVNTLTVNQSSPSASNSISFKILGNADAGGAVNENLTFNGVGSANISISSSQTDNVNLTLNADTANMVTVTGGNAASTIALSTINFGGTYNFASCASKVTATGGAFASNFIGSQTNVNTLTTGSAGNNFTGGNAADVFTISSAATSVAITGHYNNDSVGNSYVVTGIHSGTVANLVDFNCGTSSTANDTLTLTHGAGTYGASVTLVTGNDSTSTAGAPVLYKSTNFNTNLTATQNTLVYTGAAASLATVVSAINAGTATNSTNTNWGSTSHAMPLFYTNTDGKVHIAMLQVGSTTVANFSSATATDVAILGGTTDITTVDVSDLTYA